LGRIDSNTGDTLLRWDTDKFPMDVAQTTAIMAVVLEHGGLDAGGLSFYCKVQRESVDPVDLFNGKLDAMDTYVLGLRKAVKMKEEGAPRSP
jgi:xylose isomerase